jgi:AcrR family transcriptional regulator
MNDVQDKKPRITRGKSRATADRHEKLKRDLLEAASIIIETEGLAALRARTLADKVGCAVGAIYTVFPDLDAIILHIGNQTQAAMDASMQAATSTADNAGGVLLALADSYLTYIFGHPNRALALFAHRLSNPNPPPAWYQAQQEKLFARIEAALAALRPDLANQARVNLARTLFSAVHGVVLLGWEGKVRNLPMEALRAELRFLVQTIIAGLATGNGKAEPPSKP